MGELRQTFEGELQGEGEQEKGQLVGARGLLAPPVLKRNGEPVSDPEVDGMDRWVVRERQMG